MKTLSQVSGKSVRGRRWLMRIMVAGLLLLLLLVGTVSALGARASARLAAQHSPPGQMVDVGGYRMHLNCTGQGSPTVILEAGLRDFSVHWAAVQPHIGQFTRVCVYDRAGSGWSERGPLSRTSGNMVKELHTLMVTASVAKPYLLVGHSFGGMNMRLYAASYPAEVAGLVLVDPMHEEQHLRLPAYEEGNRQVDRLFRRLALLRAAGIIALGADRVPAQGLPPEASAQYSAILATTNYFETAIAESEALDQSFSEVRAANDDNLRRIPLIVISRGLVEPIPGLSNAENEQNEQVWQEMQTEVVALSQNSEQLIAERSGHTIPARQPELVVEAVRRLALAPAAHVPAPTGEVAAKPLPSRAATPAPDPTQTPTSEATAAGVVSELAFTLHTQFARGRMLFVGVGGDIDGVESPDLVVPPGATVRVTLVNGDGIAHDIYFPDFTAQSAPVAVKEARTEIAFTVTAGRSGAYVYYCTFPGHREAGQEGRLIVGLAE